MIDINTIQKQFMEWIGAVLNDDNDGMQSIDILDWPDYFKLMLEQGLYFTLFPVINHLPDHKKPDKALLNDYKKLIIPRVSIQIQYLQNIKQIIGLFKSADIPVIVFKGPSIARFYDEPEYRMMSDLDILVKAEDKIRAQQLIETMGYKIEIKEDDHPMHCGYRKKGAIFIELHTSLLHPGYLGSRRVMEWYSHIWECSKFVSFEGMAFLAMAEEDELINQILHFATHLIYAGAKMKHLYDMALLIKKCEDTLDWQYILNTLKTTNLLVLGRLIFTISMKYFHINIPSALIDEQTINVDLFIGKFLNEYSMEKEEGDQKGWRAISWRFPLICKYKALLPVAWIIEVILQLSIHKGKIFLCIKKSIKNIKVFLNKAKMLKELGLG